MISQQVLHQAIAILRKGGLVAFPTETVYGLGADANNPIAIRKIFAAKGRPANHPVIVHLADIDQLSEWSSEIPDTAWQLARAFWPGPLTLILPKKPSVSDIITGGQHTIGLRMPNHPVAKALLQAYGSGLAAPSANRFGRISPTTAQAVHEELQDKVDLILDGGQCAVGVESTIVDASTDRVVILRPGMISAAQIESVLQVPVTFATQYSPRVSGSHESHYAPSTHTRLLTPQDISRVLNTLSESAVISYLPFPQQSIPPDTLTWVQLPNNPDEYAYQIYATLRQLDQGNFKQIIIMCTGRTNVGCN